MKYKVPFILFMFLAIQASSWGMIGHRVVGQIAEQYLSKKASKEVKKILGTESLTDVANWMDFIKSEPKYNFMGPWHYCTIPDGKTYAEAGTPVEKDIIWGLRQV